MIIAVDRRFSIGDAIVVQGGLLMTIRTTSDIQILNQSTRRSI